MADDSSAFTTDFGCCLEQSLNSVDAIEDEYHLYNTTKLCNRHLDPPLNASQFIQAVIYYYIHHMENTSVCESLHTTTQQHQQHSSSSSSSCGFQTRTWYLVYVTFWSVALILGVVGNSLVCLVFMRSAMLRKTVTNYFVTSLAVSDLLVVLFVVPMKIHFTLHNQEFCAPLVFCRTLYTSDMMFFAASITNLFLISIDRYIAILRPYRYRDALTPSRVKLIIFGIWLYAGVWGLMVHFNPRTMALDAVYVAKQQCTSDNKLFHRVSYVMVFYIPSAVMFWIYFKILTISRTHARHIDARRSSHVTGNNAVGSPADQKSLEKTSSIFPNFQYFMKHKLEVRATKVILAVFGTFLVCWFPLIFLNTFHGLLPWVSFDSPVLFSIVSEVLPITNSLLNPFIYGILHRDFKRSLRRIVSTIATEYQLIGSLMRRSSQSTKSSCDGMSSQGTNQHCEDSSEHDTHAHDHFADVV